MKYLLLLLIAVMFTSIPSLGSVAFGSVTAGSEFCSAFPTHPECTGWRVEPINDNFWFCEYVELPSMCNNPPDPQKQITSRSGNYCCGVIGSHMPKNISLDDEVFAGLSKKGESLGMLSSKELLIWTERDHYYFGDRVNVFGKFNFDDVVLKNNNQFVDVSINDRKVILDLPVHSNGWFAGYFTLSNPYSYYTGFNLISVTYFHTPTQHEPNKFTQASYTITTGDITSEPFFINGKSSSGKISYDIFTESGEPVNLNLAVTRLTTPDGLVLSIPSISFVEDISDYLENDASLVSGEYNLTVTKGNYTASHTFEYVQ